MPLLSLEHDTELRNRVSNYLSSKHQSGLRNLRIDADSGTVTVSGTVRTFYEKQLAQQVCRRVAGVIKLIDNVSVSDDQRYARSVSMA